MRRLVATALFALLTLAAPAAAQETHSHSGNMRHVANLPYEARNGTTANYGTDIEFARLAGKQYALAGSYRNGMQIVDISRPERSRIAAIYDCGVTQGDVQVFKRADLPGRTFATYTSDTYGDGTSTCYREAAALGFSVLKSNGQGKNGTFILEVTDPLNPKTLSFAEVAQGSHNQTVHPGGKYMYNSNSDLITSALPAIEIIDMTDLSAPKTIGELALPTRPGLGTESHDITFNKDGSRAYSAALSQGVIIDSRNPAAPTDHLELPRPVDQRLAPDGPVHADRRVRPRARVRDRRGRVRRRGRHRPVPERRRPRVRDHRRARARAAQGRLLEHRRRPADRRPDALLHRARVRHPRGGADPHDRLLQRRRAGRGPLRPHRSLDRRDAASAARG